MSNTRKSVRYYIDRDAGAPVVRSVPVRRPEQPRAIRPSLEAAQQRGARNRLASLVKASVRKDNHDQS